LHARAQAQDFGAPGGTVRWRRFGDGPALVLLHGGHGSWLHWVRNIEPLAERRTVWVPDLPGYGDSAPPASADGADGTGEGASADGLAGLLSALRGSLDRAVGAGTPIDLAGFSFGGLVAARLAALRPGVRRLALLGPGGHGGPRRPRGELRPWKAARDAGDAAALAGAMRHNLAAHMLHAAASDIDDTALWLHTAACLATRFRSRDISRSGGLADALRRYAGPTLLAWGAHDVTAVPEDLGPRLAQALPDARWRVVPGAGHWVQYEAADAVNRMLLEWTRIDEDA
jgi:pimeloyl-ACP methyl ester carboxylesterase